VPWRLTVRRGVAEQRNQRICDRRASRLFVVRVAGGRIGFETNPATIGTSPQVDTSDRKPEFAREKDTSGFNVRWQIDGFDRRRLFRRGRISIVDGAALDAAGENAVPHHMNAKIRALDMLLNLKRARGIAQAFD
jgi:hypothetical protein